MEEQLLLKEIFYLHSLSTLSLSLPTFYLHTYLHVCVEVLGRGCASISSSIDILGFEQNLSLTDSVTIFMSKQKSQ